MKAIDAQPNTHYTRPGGTVDGIRDRDTTTRAAQLGVSEGMMTDEEMRMAAHQYILDTRPGGTK